MWFPIIYLTDMGNSPTKGRQAGAGVEITPAMVVAGVEVFLGAYPDTGAGDTLDREMVAEIFLAMLAESRGGCEIE